MSLFDLAIPTVLRREGGYSDNPADPGGATKYGISLRWLKQAGLLEELELEEGDVTHDEILAVRKMTLAEATNFYLTKWWTPNNFALIAPQMVATKVFDTAVNIGPKRAIRFLQSALNIPTPDGVIGPETAGKANVANSIILITLLQSKQAAFYQSLVQANPKLAQFLNGWTARAYDRV